MKKRTTLALEDPVTTQGKILLAATKVFAEYGFKEATTRMICQEAGVNVALVNYYFRSKAELYKAVIASLFEDVVKPLMAIPGTVSDGDSWKAAIRSWIRRSLAICAAQTPPEYWIARLMGMEQCLPSDMAQEIALKFGLPMRQCFLRLLRMAMEQDDAVEANLWYSSICAQYVVYAIAKPGWASRFCPPDMDRDIWLDRVAEHICGDIFARLEYRRPVL
jgi:AcrR family transcriptional regulator